jgi:hypothetical protein
MKIKRSLLRRIIQEEISYALMEQDLSNLGGFPNFGGFTGFAMHGFGGPSNPSSRVGLAGPLGIRSRENIIAKMKKNGFTDQEIEEFENLKTEKEIGRFLKQVFAKRNLQKEWQKMIKVHWVGDSDQLTAIMKGSRTRELSINLYHTKEQLTNYQWSNTGIILDGHITIAGDENLQTNSSVDYTKRADQKYTTSKDGVTLTPGGISGLRHNEALIDNWRIIGFFVTKNTGDSTMAIIEKSGLPYTRIESQKAPTFESKTEKTNEVGLDYWFDN